MDELFRNGSLVAFASAKSFFLLRLPTE